MNSTETLEHRILNNPGEASFLCQPDVKKGCGGCCAHFDQPRHILEGVFSARKEAYDAWVISEDDILLYRKKTDLLEKGYRQCRFLAFLDDRNETIGCLLHPGRLENKGRDLRDYGFYENSGICAANFCLSSKNVFRRDMVDRQFFLLAQEDLDWYEYSRLFSRYVDLNGTKGLFDIYVKFTRPLYQTILERLSWKELQSKGFLEQYNELIRTIVRKTKPPANKGAKEGYAAFHCLMGTLSDKRQADMTNAQIEKFVKALDG
jgi:hypothetical protein